jgi:hypothetical protein
LCLLLRLFLSLCASAEGNNLSRRVPRAAAGKLEQRSDDVCTSVIFSVRMREREIERETLFRLNNNWLMTRPRAFSHSVGISARAEAERQNVSLREPMDTKNLFIYIHMNTTAAGVVRDNLSREREAQSTHGASPQKMHSRASFRKRKMSQQQYAREVGGIYGRQAFPGLEFHTRHTDFINAFAAQTFPSERFPCVESY